MIITSIVYKDILASRKPYSVHRTDNYIQRLISCRDSIYMGDIGVYLAHRVHFDGQALYFPFIDVDAGRDLVDENEKISSAILNAALCHQVLKKLGAEKYFKIIATGGSGFRFVSNILLNAEAYRGFVRFVKMDMQHVWDTRPTEDLEMPHQLFAYKGNRNQSNRDLVDRHSSVVPIEALERGILDVDYYKDLTGGRPDPDEVIRFMRGFLNFRPIADLASLGEFGRKLAEYQKIIDELEINPFDYIQFCRSKRSISLDALHQMLSAKGILSKIEKRGPKEAISFSGLPCPVCGKRTSNARAYPPYYTLKCFNMNCSASQGMSLMKWSGIIQGTSARMSQTRAESLLELPSSYEKLETTDEIIRRELLTRDDVHLLLTPGVGKTHEALRYLAEKELGETIIYSSFNRKLQREAYEKIKSFMKSPDHVHLLEPRENLCIKTSELAEVTSKGFSPSEVLCSVCEHRSGCKYFAQRENMGSGIYFVTHHMLQYLEPLFPSPNMIILDENLVSGFLLEDKCTELEMTTLSAILDTQDYALVNRIIEIARRISLRTIKDEREQALYVNGARRFDTDDHDTILSIMAQQCHAQEEAMKERISGIVTKIEEIPRSQVYKRNVNGKAIEWLKGLVFRNPYSYLLVSRKGQISFNIKYLTPLGYKHTPVKILDATGSGKIAEVLTQRPIRVVRADVEWRSRRIHVQTNTSRGVMKHSSDKDLRRLLEKVLKEMAGKKLMLVTYKFLKDRMLRLCREIEPAREYMAYHFNGPRGVNDYENCDGVIVLGLPYSNLNSSWQDANILLPRAEDADLRESWVESCMQWEMIQDIHRIRPVRKDYVEIAVISKLWPRVLPEPDHVVDLSKSEHWKDLAISRLEPFVREFGFLNPDIGFLAGVYLKQKINVAESFRDKVSDVLTVIKYPNSKSSPLLPVEKDSYAGVGSLDMQNPTNNLEQMRCKLINVIYNLYYIKLLERMNLLPLKVFRLYQQAESASNDDIIILSTNQQWAELTSYFKDKYPHYKSFKIKLPYSRNNYVSGVGAREKVIEFYEQLSELRLFGRIDTDSYKVDGDNAISIDSIPEGVIVIHIPDIGPDIVHIHQGGEIKTVGIERGMDVLKEALTSNPELKVITNDSKYLSKRWLDLSGKEFDLSDILFNERIIQNGKDLPKPMTLNYLYDSYGLPKDPDVNAVTIRLYEIWEKQRVSFRDMGLQKIVDMENKIIWITSAIENNGIGIDVVKALEMEESLIAEKRRVETELGSQLPEHVSFRNHEDMLNHFREKYYIPISNLDIDALRSINHPAAQNIIAALLLYRTICKQLSDLSRYISLTGNDDRVHDKINQLATVTGRFSCVLHSVSKGPMRSLFKAKEGYRFIITDYSQQEVRIMSALSKDMRSSQIFSRGGDIYMDVAMNITGKPVEECKRYRDVAKSIVLGVNYGRSEFSIHEELNRTGITITLEEVRSFLRRYYELFPQIVAWRQGIVKQARRDGFLSTTFGRRLKVSEDTGDRSLYNYPVQATGSDGFKLALIYLYEGLRDKDTRIVHTMHDEIIVEAKSEIADDLAAAIQKCMKQPFEEMFSDVHFEVKPTISHTWTA